MTRITHLKTLPKNVDYWDYYVLCRLDSNAGLILQRMEYWDGTKAGGIVHSEQINDNLTEAGTQPTQDVSRYVYKSREELAWELLDACSERTAYETLDYLSKTLHYLKTRHNPYKAFDRTLQYEFQEKLVQDHLERLYAIVKHFSTLGRQQRPVLYAIEELTRKEYYIHRVEKEDGSLDGKGVLTIKLVTKQLRQMHHQMHLDNEANKKLGKGEKKAKPVLPSFIRLDLKKDEMQGFSETQDLPFPLCMVAQSNTSNLHNASGQNCTMECAEEHNASCNPAQAIPVTTTMTTNTNYNSTEEKSITANADDATPSPSFANGEDDGTNNANTASLQSDHHSSVNGVTVRVDVRHSEEVNGQSTSTENEENNRLTSTPESPSQQNVSTDESPLRIASKTANETPSSPVIEPTNDEMIHADARKDGDSYSPQSTVDAEQTEKPTQPPTEEKPRRRRTRKPRVVPPPFEVPEELKPRVEKVYTFLNSWRQRKLDDPEECFERDAESDEAVCSLFKGKPPTEKRLEALCDRIWNEKRNPNTGYLPREHMTIKTICKQYKAQSMSLAADEMETKGIVSTATKIAGYTMKPDLNDDEEVIYLRKENKTPRKRA
jgi:hypothetical protein